MFELEVEDLNWMECVWIVRGVFVFDGFDLMECVQIGGRAFELDGVCLDCMSVFGGCLDWIECVWIRENVYGM